jgi:transcription factor S
MDVEFCDCGGVMMPVKGGMECRSCGKITKKEAAVTKLTTQAEKKEIIVVDSNKPDLPTTTKLCQKCGNNMAYWWLIQTRSADEPPTQFFKCTNEKCNYTWREYK